MLRLANQSLAALAAVLLTFGSINSVVTLPPAQAHPGAFPELA